MEMSQIRYFIALSETLNFTRAAEQCCISQPALTKGIKKLESIIGGELFYRTKNSVELSELGRVLLPNFKEIYFNAKQTKEEAQRILNRDNPRVKIGFQSSIAFEVICRLVENFRSHHPHIEIEYCEGGFAGLNDKFNHHEIDILLGSRVSSRDDFKENDISSEPFVLVFNRRHAFIKREALKLKDLESEKLLIRQHCESSAKLYDSLSCRGYNLRGLCYSRRDDWIPRFVDCENGIAIVPRSFAISNGMLFLPITDFPMYQSIYTIRHNGYQRNKYVDELFYSVINPANPSESVA